MKNPLACSLVLSAVVLLMNVLDRSRTFGMVLVADDVVSACNGKPAYSHAAFDMAVVAAK